jgi:hypothetical protein
MLQRRKVLFFTSLFCFIQIFTLNSFAFAEISYSSTQSENIQTNFLFVKKDTYKISDQPVVIAASGKTVWASARNSAEIQEFSLSSDGLTRVRNIILPIKENSHTIILDLEALTDSKLLVSVASYFDDPTLCSTANVYLISDNLSTIQKVFTSKPCIGGVSAWTEIAGRISVDAAKNLFYLSGGNVETNLYGNFFPRDGLCCLTGTFEEEMKRTNLFGSIVKVDLNSLKSNKISVGHRAPQGLFYDRERNILFETEHGPRGGDELNTIKNGKDYGWPFVTFGRFYLDEQSTTPSGYNKKRLTNTHDGYEPPIFSWTPSIGVSNLISISKKSVFSKYWSQDLIVSTLKDHSLRRLKLNKNNSILYDERIEIGLRIRDIAAVDEGIILSTDFGHIIVISPTSIKVGGQFP